MNLAPKDTIRYKKKKAHMRDKNCKKVEEKKTYCRY